MTQETAAVLQLLDQHEEQIITEWLQEAGSGLSRITDAGRRAMRSEAQELAQAVRSAFKAGADPDDLQTAAWSDLRQALEALSRSRAAQGQSAGDTSAFVLAFKRPVFTLIQRDLPRSCRFFRSAPGRKA